MKTARALAIGAALASLSASPALSAPKSLFVQVVSVPAGAEAYKTRTWFKKVCDEHKQSGSPTYIYDLVLSEIADTNGKLDTERLDIVEDYFGCFDNVFVGTANLSHPDPYVSGMKDSDFRWANIYLSESVAKAYDARFSQRFPGGVFHWYVSYEANLNAFTIDVALKNAYAAYLLELSNRLTAIRPGSILWSPAFWTKYASVSNKSALAAAVKNVLDTAPKVNWLHFQDFVGQAAQRSCSSGAVSYGFSSADGIGYRGLLAGSGAQLASLQVNMEHFVLGGASCPAGAIYPGEKTELAARENAYQAAGIPIGASWEIRWWYLALYGQEPQTCNQPESCDGVDNDCDLLVDEGNVCPADAGTAGSSGAGGAGGSSGSSGSSGSTASGGASGSSASWGGSAGSGGAGDAGTDPGQSESEDGGCGCRQASPMSTSSALGGLVMLLLLARRRR